MLIKKYQEELTFKVFQQLKTTSSTHFPRVVLGWIHFCRQEIVFLMTISVMLQPFKSKLPETYRLISTARKTHPLPVFFFFLRKVDSTTGFHVPISVVHNVTERKYIYCLWQCPPSCCCKLLSDPTRIGHSLSAVADPRFSKWWGEGGGLSNEGTPFTKLANFHWKTA